MDSQALIDRHKNKVINIIILIVAAIIAYKIYNSQLEKTGLLKKSIEIEIKKNKALENLVSLEGRLSDYRNQFAKKEARLFMNKINTLAKQSEVTIISIKPMAEEVQKDYSKFPFNLTVSAFSYHDLGRFISSIESNKDIYRIESAGVIYSDSDKDLSVDLVVSSIVFKD